MPNHNGALSEPSHEVLQQAAEWYAHLRDGQAGAKARAEWQHWLLAAEEHQTAWRLIEEIRQGFSPLPQLPDPRRIAQGLCAANDRLRGRRRMLASVAALAGTGLLGWLGWRDSRLIDQPVALAPDYRTAIGEQREIALSDGSRLWLNTASALDVRFDERTRHIRLRDGEVFIATAPDPRRPFLVDTAHGRLHALGTRFNVWLDGNKTRLAVYEGAVEVRTSSGDATRIVTTGQQARFTHNDIAQDGTADPARAAWKRGALVAHNIRLADVIQELGRYREGKIEVAISIADLKVFGNFPIRDTDRVLVMLASALPIRIDRSDPSHLHIKAARHH